MASGIAYGVDFGAWNCALAIRTPDGATILARDPYAEAGVPTIPSSVCVDSYGSVLVGHRAERLKHTRPDSYIRSFKRDFGRKDPIPLGSRSFTADELVTEVLRFLRESAESIVPGRPDCVVITVPVSWQGPRRSLMLKAASAAGFAASAVRLEDEPVAALAHVFLSQPGEAPSKVLVYDFGGATFDCAVAIGSHAGYQVLGGPGGVHVGGMDIDGSLVESVRQKFPEKTAGIFLSDDALGQRLALIDTCEWLKCRMSERLRDSVPLAEFDLTLTREELSQLARPLVRQTIQTAEALLASAAVDLTWKDIDEIVTVGGSSRLTVVGELFAEAFGHQLPERDLWPRLRQAADLDMAVARGAALLARSPWMADVESQGRALAVTDDGTLVVACAKGNLIALDAMTGQRLWECAVANNEEDPVGLLGQDSRGRVVVVHESGRVRVIDRGSSQDLPVRISSGAGQGPAICYDMLFFVDDDGTLHGFDLHSESDRWTLTGEDRISSVPLVAYGMLFAATTGGRVIAIDAATGQRPAPTEKKSTLAVSLEVDVEYRNGEVILRAPGIVLPNGPFLLAALIRRVGDNVAEDQPLMQLRSGPHAIEVLAPVSGTVAELPFRLADWVGPGAVVATVTLADTRGQGGRRP